MKTYLSDILAIKMFCNLCHIVLKLGLFLSLTNAKAIKSVENLPGSPIQIEKLARSVCNDLSSIPDKAAADAFTKACPTNFLSEHKRLTNHSEVKVRCRWSKKMQLEVTPSPWWQIVVLMPGTEEEHIINYSLIGPKKKYSEISVFSPFQNYTMYSSVINKDGRLSLWHRQESVMAWNEYEPSLPEQTGYDVQVQFLNYSRVDNRVTGIVTWNHTGESDACFRLTNFCGGKIIPVNVWPDMNQRVIILNLPVDEECQLVVTGLYGSTELEYHTPVGEAHLGNDSNIKDVTNDSALQVPKDVYIEAVADGDGWEVRVAWARPTVQPERYTVVLRANREHTVQVAGNATEATFTGVTGEGLYNVSLYAYKGKFEAHTFKRALFIATTEWRWVGAAGGAWAAAALCLLGVVLCWLKLRSRQDTEKPKGQESKPLDDALATLESECEDQWEIKIERLVLHEVIGEGAFGKVRRGVLAPTGKEVAVKMLKDFPTTDEIRAFRLEMEVMKSVGAHGHVVSLVGCCSGRRALLVQEYCAQGDLLGFLRRSWDVMVSKRNAKNYNNNTETDDRNDLFKCKPQRDHSRLVVNNMYDIQSLCDAELTSLTLLSFCRQIAMGMEFLAANRLVHRDLAARNILVTSDRTLKIADFGLSRDVYEENQYRQKGNGKMPVKWMAPESLSRRIYTSQSDVWSFGVVVWEVVTVGGSPYAGVPPARLPRLLRAGYRMPRPINCSRPLYEVMLSCWREHPRSRPTFSALHRRLDDLLNSACADDYLSLDLPDEPPPHPALTYLKMMIRGKRAWNRETYERPIKAPQGNHNHYSSPPVTISKGP